MLGEEMKFDEIQKLVTPDIDGWQFLYEAAMRAPIGNIVEIGCACGNSSVCLVGAAHERNGHCYLIDPLNSNEEDRTLGHEVAKITEESLLKNLRALNLRNYWTYIKNYSWEIAKIFKEPISFLFIDGCHVYECVKKDWENWSPKIVKNGIIVMHDAGFESVERLIVEIEQSKFPSRNENGSEIFIKKGD